MARLKLRLLAYNYFVENIKFKIFLLNFQLTVPRINESSLGAETERRKFVDNGNFKVKHNHGLCCIKINFLALHHTFTRIYTSAICRRTVPASLALQTPRPSFVISPPPPDISSWHPSRLISILKGFATHSQPVQAKRSVIPLFHGFISAFQISSLTQSVIYLPVSQFHPCFSFSQVTEL